MNAVLPWPVETIAEWMPFWKAAGFFLATFILEDAAAIGAGLLLAAGAMSWPTAFAACFLGIWTGDAGLYAVSRLGGRRWFECSSLKRFSKKVQECEQWFAERGTAVLVFSRMIPGARLPTYLAAGFLRVPLARFLWVTGLASFVWTFAVLWLTQTLGGEITRWLRVYKSGGLLLLGAGVVLFVAFQSARYALSHWNFRGVAMAIRRLWHWEFWPGWIFYPPVAVYCAWLAIKYRGLTLPTAANPGIFSGGIVGESKIDTLQGLMTAAPEFTAEAEAISGSTADERLLAIREICERRQIPYPFVMKPDVGQRGAGVKLIRAEQQAMDYLKQTGAPLIVQRYVEGPREVGIFYYRFPHDSSGHIFAITEKIFPTVTGDGEATISELIRRDPRARLIADKYLSRLGNRGRQVPRAGEIVKLVEAGNHAQGCIFREGMHLCTRELVRQIDTISRKLPGFYIGRYDVRYATDEDLRAGRNFQIIELNGAASEATSIYDSRNSLATAYRTLFRQWDLVFAIGAANRARGTVTTRLSLVLQKMREYDRLTGSYPLAD
jgi:membrane protein DedA with SNARE-associated domain